MEQLARHLCEIKDAGNCIADWEQHWRACFLDPGARTQIKGIGLSTYSKLLYFMKTKANGYQCLILDQVLINVFAARKFEEFSQLHTISYQTAPTLYPAYLELMQKESSALGVTPDQLEMFLFMFGPILK